MTLGLIEDEDGAPYPQCKWCPDQIKPVTGIDLWVHVSESDGRRSYLYRCQRPYDGVYGHEAERDEQG